MIEHPREVFLGGACGDTTWRQDVAIPALQAAGVTFFDPQLGPGEWTPACEPLEMKAKAEAEVLLFVLGEHTRGVATAAEVAYYLASGRALALAITDVPRSAIIDGVPIQPAERDDLNRGRIFVRSMAREHGVPVFTTIEAAVQHAIQLVHTSRTPLTLTTLRRILDDIEFPGLTFVPTETAAGFQLHVASPEWTGRPWLISPSARRSDVVRTALKAVLTWQEHEAREMFLYRGVPVFGPHGDVEALARCRSHARRAPHTEPLAPPLDLPEDE